MLARKSQKVQRRQADYQPRRRIEHPPSQDVALEPRIMLNVGLRRQCFLLIAVISIFAILITARSSIIAAKGHEISVMTEKAITIETENAQLQIAIAQMRNPSRVMDLAVHNFGMSVPQQVYFASGH